ncbi:arylamine N-acetyltransferase [Bifidobacterium pullorum subsp. gallinarum]
MYKEVSTYLEYLKVDIVDDQEELLTQIIRKHQIKIPFETATKLLTYKQRLPQNIISNNFNFKGYVENLTKYGYGGTCFNLTFGLYELLNYLEFKVEFLHLSLGHYCLSVTVGNKEYYVDVGFMAPLFELYPLRGNWEINKFNEHIKWIYKDRKGVLILHNGHTRKSWDGTYINRKDFLKDWEQSYNENSNFIRNTFITKWKNLEEIITVHERVFKWFNKGNLEEQKFIDDDYELEEVLKNLFGVDPTFYLTALYEKKGTIIKS